MKQSIIKTCDIIAYLLFAFVFVTTAFTALTGNILHALMFLVIGWVIASLISGVCGFVCQQVQQIRQRLIYC